MIERPIIFSAPMVRAILDGKKTQTRRIVKPQPPDRPPGMRPHKMSLGADDEGIEWFVTSQSAGTGGWFARSPYGGPPTKYGPVSRLWVRETGWERPERTQKMMRDGADTWERYYYDADGLVDADHEQFKAWGFKRRPSIFMPRWASRITLEITGVRVELLQDISKTDCIAEGMTNLKDVHAGWHQSYAQLWDKINAKRAPWASNPWVWIIEFKRV